MSQRIKSIVHGRSIWWNNTWILDGLSVVQYLMWYILLRKFHSPRISFFDATNNSARISRGQYGSYSLKQEKSFKN